MTQDNNERPEEKAAPKIEVVASMDLPNGVAMFTEKKVDGIVMLEPKVIIVPIQSIIVMACQAILAMNGIASGAVRVTKEGATQVPEKKIITS